MTYLIITVLLFLIMLVYFKIADRYNIIDKPNHRSAHTEITLRGGGVVFPATFLLYLISSYLIQETSIPFSKILPFGLGLLAICLISFIDDVVDLNKKIRLAFHFIAVTLLLYFLEVFQLMPLWSIPLLYILIIGILNAYNFMDGINGITGLYSLVILGSLLYVNYSVIGFADTDFIIFPMLACIVFLFFNFRKKAKCFMGDIGSLGIAFWVIALIGMLMIKTGELKWILFLTVYGTDVVFTIVERLKLKENIFEPHRKHLYQLFANEHKVSHLLVSFTYALIQLIVNAVIIFTDLPEIYLFALILLPTLIFYIYLKYSVKKRVLHKVNL